MSMKVNGTQIQENSTTYKRIAFGLDSQQICKEQTT